MPSSLIPPESPPPEVGETRDGNGSGDHDRDFTWGNPRSYLTLMMQARLQIMRGEFMDARRGETGGAADGDVDWIKVTETGLFVPEAVAGLPKAPRAKKRTDG